VRGRGELELAAAGNAEWATITPARSAPTKDQRLAMCPTRSLAPTRAGCHRREAYKESCGSSRAVRLKTATPRASRALRRGVGVVYAATTMQHRLPVNPGDAAA
jgi:hypothetical protein